jgi:catechol 2,3-dioxygenase-like lactoylglutathione lyase family enzyme
VTLSERPRLVGINHVALEVGDVEAAVEFYGRLFELGEVERQGTAAFIELGDQFIALMQGRSQPQDTTRHFGLVVDDKERTRSVLEAAGVEILPGRFLDFLDPWGNRVQVVQYDQIRFAKTSEVLEEMGLAL